MGLCYYTISAGLILKHTKKSLVSVSLVVKTILGEILMWLASPGLPYMWGRQFAICGRNSATPKNRYVMRIGDIDNVVVY